MSRTKRKGDGPVHGVRNDEKGREGVTRHSKAERKSTRTRIIHLTKRDFIRQTFRAGGKGGQKQNKTETGVRFIHPPSGARGESREERTQLLNERIAFRRMAESPKMKLWIAARHQETELTEQAVVEIHSRVESMMNDVLVEVKDAEGNWVTLDTDALLMQ